MFKLLKYLYVNFWVPVFGRILSVFIRIIEGKEVNQKPTYDIDNINKTNDGDKY